MLLPFIVNLMPMQKHALMTSPSFPSPDGVLTLKPSSISAGNNGRGEGEGNHHRGTTWDFS